MHAYKVKQPAWAGRHFWHVYVGTLYQPDKTMCWCLELGWTTYGLAIIIAIRNKMKPSFSTWLYETFLYKCGKRVLGRVGLSTESSSTSPSTESHAGFKRPCFWPGLLARPNIKGSAFLPSLVGPVILDQGRRKRRAFDVRLSERPGPKARPFETSITVGRVRLRAFSGSAG